MSNEKKTGGLGDIIERIRNGASSLNSKAKNPEGSAAAEPTVGDHESEQLGKPVIDDLSDPLLIDPQDHPQPDKKAKAKMTIGKKVALGAVVVCAIILAKNGVLTPGAPTQEPGDVKAASSASKPTDSPLGSQQAYNEVESDLKAPLGDQTADDPAVGQTLSDLRLEGPFQKPLDAETVPVVSAQIPPAGDGFGFPSASDSTPSTPQPVATVAPSAPVVPQQASSPFGATEHLVTAPAPNDSPNVFAGIPSPAKPTPIPTITGAEKHDPVLGSTPLQNPDSSPQPSQQSSAVDVSEMKAQLNAKDLEIKSLTEQLAAKQAPKPSRTHAKPKASVASIPKRSATVEQRAKPKATVAAAKVYPRPKLCVKAVAPPARNCPSCVAHAFVVDAGGENMVGQGDFLDGYRISIAGDRLDLQNSDGQVVHKFWSQQNGCSTI
ncbi:hypothetical protein [Pseudomonas violetae]|uniref:Uncharacterized protein n=1 Tax=Pseudomonas violetae TaxID=2915813 RepID=A0ABT0ET55_9PSED|nr:hypothetical protein [Pseudomonas violetae]MCK1788910.1 hypothetical protein [Pseudomonas violetae]